MSDNAADIIYLGEKDIPFDIPNGLHPIYDMNFWLKLEDKLNRFPLFNVNEYLTAKEKSAQMNFLLFDINNLTYEFMNQVKKDTSAVLVLETKNSHGMAEQRRVFFDLIQNEIKNPVIIKRSYSDITVDQLTLFNSTDFGSLLIDGYGDGVWAEVKNIIENDVNDSSKESLIKNFVKNESKEKVINRILFGTLQAARVRISKTEYIACPSCGRTLFDLQETTEMIRKRTEHLKGVKIAIMGCIVNGPGEMADADYGYVGSGAGKITLYREKDVVKRNIPAKNAVDELIELIKEDHNWIEPN